MHITFTNHVQHTPVVLDQVEHPNFIDQTHDAIKELLKALKSGLRTIDLHERVWTALSLKKDSINKVIFLWDKCIGAIINRQGEPLLESVTELMKAQGEHPAEFSVLISHMERMKMKNIFKYLQALGNVYLMYEAFSWDDQPLKDFHLNKAVQIFHKAGVSEDDPVLERYRQIFVSSIEMPKFLMS